MLSETSLGREPPPYLYFGVRQVVGIRDVAMRELAAAHVQRESDLYRRLLAVQSVKLRVPEDVLDRRARRYVDSIRFAGFVGELDRQDPLLVCQVKSTTSVSGNTGRGYDIWYRVVSSKASLKDVFEDLTDEPTAAFSDVRMVHNTIVHTQPLDVGRVHSLRLVGDAILGFRERVYGRERKPTRLAG